MKELRFVQYRRREITLFRPYKQGEGLSDNVSISVADKDGGSPKEGDMIGCNPPNREEWLITKAYFETNFEPA